MDDIQGTRQVQAVKRQRPQYRKMEKTRADLLGCYNCGKTHTKSDTCPAAESTCRCCTLKGHWACVCLKKKRDQKSGARRQQQPQNRSKGNRGYYGKKNVHTVNDNGESNKADDDFVLDTVETTPLAKLESIFKEGSKSQAFANVKMTGQDTDVLVKYKIDSGAEVNVMPLHIFKHLFPDKQDKHGRSLRLHKPKVGLSAYGGTKVKQYGCFTLRCTHTDIALDIEFHVTQDSGSTMLGLQASMDLRLISLNCEQKSACYDCHDTSQVSSLKKEGDNPSFSGRKGDAKGDLLNKYPKCFRGLFSGEYHIDLKQDVEPVIHPPRRVLESLKESVKKKLSRMIQLDIIEKVDQPTGWVNSVVYVTKPSGEIRICLDPKDLNTWTRRPHHYTHAKDDILPQLQGASVFTILDARSGYWNVKLDESKLLTTFNTPYGPYCFRRFPFGLVSAQDVFQKKVYQTFEGFLELLQSLMTSFCSAKQRLSMTSTWTTS